MRPPWTRPRGLPSPWIVVIATALVCVGARTGDSRASEGDALRNPALILVHLAGFGRADWRHAHGVPGKRAYDHFLANGQIRGAEELAPSLADRLDRWSQTDDGELLWLEEDAFPIHDSGDAPPLGRLPFGPPEQRVHVDWEGEIARGRVLGAARDLDTALWLNRPDVVRWEEVVEMLDLTRTENLAFRRLTDEDHPLVQLRSAFLRDKRGASLALYLNARYRPRFLRLNLELPSVFVETVQPFADQVDESEDGRYFAARVRNSMPSVAGRVDRILQSLYAEASKDTWVIVDARESLDPFVAWIGPSYGLRTNDVVAVLPPLSARTQ